MQANTVDVNTYILPQNRTFVHFILSAACATSKMPYVTFIRSCFTIKWETVLLPCQMTFNCKMWVLKISVI